MEGQQRLLFYIPSGFFETQRCFTESTVSGKRGCQCREAGAAWRTSSCNGCPQLTCGCSRRKGPRGRPNKLRPTSLFPSPIQPGAEKSEIPQGSQRRLRLASFGLRSVLAAQEGSEVGPRQLSLLLTVWPSRGCVPSVTFFRSPGARCELSVLSEEYPSPGSITRSRAGFPPLEGQLAMAMGGDQHPK